MRHRTAVGMVCGVFAAGGWAVATSVQAQDSDPLDALREEVPESYPGDYDITEADAIYGRLVEAYGESSIVDDFGDGSKLTGLCGGYAYSYDQDGNLIDAAMDLGDDGPPVDIVDGTQAFTSSNPFKVDTRGLVQYFGFSPRDGDGPLDHTWEIKTSGISVDQGGDPNPNLKNRNSGVVDLAEDLPIKFSAKVRVEGFMNSQNQPDCIGEGHVEFIGNGLTDPIGLAALALLGGGLFGLLFNARPAYTYKSGG